MWPKFERKPVQDDNEVFVCAVDGTEEFRLVSGIFKQNLYSGVYQDLNPRAIPEDLNLFDVDEYKYPLLKELEDDGLILKATINKGDCLYIPAFYYEQSRTVTAESTMLTFTYESASRLTDLFFEAINSGLLEQNQKAIKKKGGKGIPAEPIEQSESEVISTQDNV
jgi:hypothetical protein